MNRRHAFVAIAALSVLGVPASPIDLSVRLHPEISIPMGDAGEAVYSIGGGGSLAAETELFRIAAPFIEAGVRFLPLLGGSDTMALSAAGAGTGFFLYPVPRLKLRIAGGGGVFNAAALDGSRYGLYFGANAEAGYRFSPSLSVLAGAGYSRYLNSPVPSDSFIDLASVTLSLDWTLGSPSARSSGVSIEPAQSEAILPIRYYDYERVPFGVLRLRNDESAEIRDLEINFRAEGLTPTLFRCATFKAVPRGGVVEAPLLAALGERVLDYTESTKAQGEVIVRYRLLDILIERSFAVPISVTHRNAMTWKDPRALAAFASPNDASVLDLSKFIAGLIRERIRPDIDHALQYGMGLFEGLRLIGLTFAEDPSSRYADFRGDQDRIDYVQYPYQTFAYRGGDSDDLAVLYAAALASVGLAPALIPLPTKAYAAFALDSSVESVGRFFADQGSFVFRDGKAWVVVDVTKLREGFLSAWKAGSQAWAAAERAGPVQDFYPLSVAWANFRPVGVGGADLKAPKPREDRLELAFENAMAMFVSVEIGPRVERLRTEMGPSGGTARQHNSLGVLYARYGLYTDAKTAFAAAAERGSRPAIVNLGNILFLLREYDEAARVFEQALRGDPENKAALLGLARSRYELDAYAEADELFARVNSIDPAFATNYAYLSSRVGSGASRASAAADRKGSVQWQEGD